MSDSKKKEAGKEAGEEPKVEKKEITLELPLKAKDFRETYHNMSEAERAQLEGVNVKYTGRRTIEVVGTLREVGDVLEAIYEGEGGHGTLYGKGAVDGSIKPNAGVTIKVTSS